MKDAGEAWTVQEKRGRKTFSRGVWAPAETIERVRADLDAERSTEQYARRRQVRRRPPRPRAGGLRRRVSQSRPRLPGIRSPVRRPRRKDRPGRSGTRDAGRQWDGRAQRIPVKDRAAAAVIAWMRHQTTDYDEMHIHRVKGERRKRTGGRIEAVARLLPPREDRPADCPLLQAVVMYKLPESDRDTV